MKRRLLSLVCLLAVGACKTPDEQMIAAHRGIFDEVAPRYGAYLAADQNLDDFTRGLHTRTLQVWDRMIRSMEEAVK